MADHTPTPWTWAAPERPPGEGFTFGPAWTGIGTCDTEADAAFVCRAVNAHADMLKACEAALAYDRAIDGISIDGKRLVESDELDILYEAWLGAARAALAKARGDYRG